MKPVLQGQLGHHPAESTGSSHVDEIGDCRRHGTTAAQCPRGMLSQSGMIAPDEARQCLVHDARRDPGRSLKRHVGGQRVVGVALGNIHERAGDLIGESMLPGEFDDVWKRPQTFQHSGTTGQRSQGGRCSCNFIGIGGEHMQLVRFHREERMGGFAAAPKWECRSDPSAADEAEVFAVRVPSVSTGQPTTARPWTQPRRAPQTRDTVGVTRKNNDVSPSGECGTMWSWLRCSSPLGVGPCHADP